MFHRSLVAALALVVSATLVGGCAGTKVKKSSALTATEQKFLVTAAQDGHAEVAAGNMAIQKGTNQQVKDFGTRMVNDHRAANDELAQIAKKNGITLPKRPDEQHLQQTTMMQQMQGAEFDKAYIGAQVADHAKAVAKFEDMSKSASDPEVKAFANRHLPMMRDHLDQAKRINESLGGGGTR